MEDRIHVRVDNRLLHGQVVQFWIGHLEIAHLIVADDEVARTEAMSAIYRMALPENVDLTVIPVKGLPQALTKTNQAVAMVLIREVSDAVSCLVNGIQISRLTIGNVHIADDRKRITDSVYLSSRETDELSTLVKKGIAVEIQTFPGEVLRLTIDDEGGKSWSRP